MQKKKRSKHLNGYERLRLIIKQKDGDIEQIRRKSMAEIKCTYETMERIKKLWKEDRDYVSILRSAYCNAISALENEVQHLKDMIRESQDKYVRIATEAIRVNAELEKMKENK